jgi:hypothetical protein
MSRPRHSIAQLMAVVIFVGIGFAALRNANVYWASATFTLAIVLIAATLVGAIVRKGRARATWTGFAVFGWLYLLIELLPPRTTGSLGFGPIPWPHLLIAWGIAWLTSYSYPSAPGGTDPLSHEQVSHSLGIILFGLVGAVLGRLLVVKDDRPDEPGR